MNEGRARALRWGVIAQNKKSSRCPHILEADVAFNFRHTLLVVLCEFRKEIALHCVGCRSQDLLALSHLPAKLIQVVRYVLLHYNKRIENRTHRNPLSIIE